MCDLLIYCFLQAFSAICDNIITTRYDPLRPDNTRYDRYDPLRFATVRYGSLRFAIFRFSRFGSHGSVLTVRFARFGSQGSVLTVGFARLTSHGSVSTGLLLTLLAKYFVLQPCNPQPFCLKFYPEFRLHARSYRSRGETCTTDSLKPTRSLGDG